MANRKNNLGQRTSVTATGTSFTTHPDWNWGYDSRWQVVSSEHVNTSASSRYFAFDGIGNRSQQRAGTATSTGGTATSYTADINNRYSAIDSLSPAYSLSPGYDDDGNMTSGPLPVAPTVNATLAWDAENHLGSITTAASVTTSYLYDGLSRRVMKTTGSGSGARTYFIYDGWNLVAEYQGDIPSGGTPVPTLTLLRTYAWGTDLSGSLQGAGGVGGLLATCLHTGTTGVYYPLYDGNGNVTQYIDTSGTVAAKYEYGPFGELLTSGGIAGEFPLRFSTKYFDVESGFYYYGYRYYDTNTGRWPSPDPIGEQGGVNLYGMLGNNAVEHVDHLGLISGPFGDCCEPGTKRKAKFKKEYVSIDGMTPGDLDPFQTEAVDKSKPKLRHLYNPYNVGAREGTRVAIDNYFTQQKDMAKIIQDLRSNLSGYLWVLVDYEQCERGGFLWLSTNWKPTKTPFKYKCGGKRFQSINEVDFFGDSLPCIVDAEDAAVKMR